MKPKGARVGANEQFNCVYSQVGFYKTILKYRSTLTLKIFTEVLEKKLCIGTLKLEHKSS